jgi:hypothetical protein
MFYERPGVSTSGIFLKDFSLKKPLNSLRVVFSLLCLLQKRTNKKKSIPKALIHSCLSANRQNVPEYIRTLAIEALNSQTTFIPGLS